MDRNKFFNQVRGLRGWDSRLGFHTCLDSMVENVTGKDKEDTMAESLEQDLENDVMRVIKRIQEAKKKEKLQSQAKGWVEKIKQSLDAVE